MRAVSTFEAPYPHGVVEQVLADEVAEGLADWIADPATWLACDQADPPRRSFYWSSHGAPAPVADLLTVPLMAQLRMEAQEAFGKRFAEDFPVSANRYPAGQGIRIHNDYFPDPAAHRHFFTHRLIIYLSRDVDPGNGGLLGIFEQDDPATQVRTIVPGFNAGTLMAMGPHSHHAVSTVRTGVRYSLGFSFTNTHGGY
jgi:2OG-Fe(II) oxygenase superfamily